MYNELEDKKIAVCQGNYLIDGGAAKVAEEIARTFDAPLYVGFEGNKSSPPDDIDFNVLFDSRIAKVISKSSYLRDIAGMDWWEHVEELHDYDIIIQSGNEPGWYIPKDEQTIVKYCHAPPRTPYESFHEKGDSFITRLYSKAVRTLYMPSTKYPTRYIVPSELVKRRVKKYWNLDSQVVYPPINVNKYKANKEREDYYLAFSRLSPDKRILEIAQAFSDMNKNIIIGGKGEQENKIKKISEDNDNIEFVGFMDENEKIRRLSECKALIFNPLDEAFGIVPIEAMASGAPVIGVNDGYTKYQINDGANGILYDRGELINGIKRFENNGVEMSHKEIKNSTDKYSLKRFKQEMMKQVLSAYKDDKIE
jgi:glycosyltransferase involved in cell wall biosynthesis